MPWRTMAAFECRSWQREPIVLLTCVLWIAVVAFASAQGIRQYRLADADRVEMLAREQARDDEYARRAAASTKALGGAAIDPLERWVRHGPTHPLWLGRSWGAVLAQSPTPPLSALVTGNVSSPSAYRVGTDMPVELSRSGAQTEHPLRQMMGRLDLGFLVLYMMPLFAIAWLYDVIASERENGTLALVRAQGISPAALVLVRTVLRGFVIVLPIAAAASVTTLVVSAGDWSWLARGAMWIAVVTAYGAFWLALAARAAAMGQSAATTALALAGAWCAICIVVPSAVQAAAAEAAPLPSRAGIVALARQAQAEAAEAAPAEALAAYLNAHPDAPVDRARALGLRDFPLASADQTLIIEARQQQVAARLAPAFGTLDDQRDRQRSVAAWLSLASPTTATYAALVELAGTGDVDAQWFEDAVRKLHTNWRAFLIPRGLTMTPLTPEDYARLPRFSTGGTALAHVAPIAVRACGVLMLLTLVLASGTRRRLRS